MRTVPDIPTRMPADLVEAAKVEGARQNRSAKQQLEHWARVGREISQPAAIGISRMSAALAGEMPLGDLSLIEREAVNAELNARIEARTDSINVGAILRKQGITTVALDEDGRLRSYLPDGTSELLG